MTETLVKQEITFQEFPKIHRLSREIVITEKLDGTNAQVIITEDGQIGAASRTKLITPEQDNYGFAKWVQDNKDELMKLGPGRHYGEWWGVGIQRNYGLSERRFSLFNVGRWTEEEKPKCCHLVPVLRRCDFDTEEIKLVMKALKYTGSHAAPGFMRPEGIVIYHTQANRLFKKTFEKDEAGKEHGA